MNFARPFPETGVAVPPAPLEPGVHAGDDDCHDGAGSQAGVLSHADDVSVALEEEGGT